MRESGRIVWIRGLRVRRWQRVRSWDWRCGLRGWLGSGKRARRLRSDWHASRIPGRSFGQTVLRDFPTAVTDIRKRKHSAVLSVRQLASSARSCSPERTTTAVPVACHSTRTSSSPGATRRRPFRTEVEPGATHDECSGGRRGRLLATLPRRSIASPKRRPSLDLRRLPLRSSAPFAAVEPGRPKHVA